MTIVKVEPIIPASKMLINNGYSVSHGLGGAPKNVLAMMLAKP